MLRRPSGRAPRGFPNWDATDGVWRNDKGETALDKKERHALAMRELRQRKKHKPAQEVARDVNENAHDSDSEGAFPRERMCSVTAVHSSQ